MKIPFVPLQQQGATNLLNLINPFNAQVGGLNQLPTMGPSSTPLQQPSNVLYPLPQQHTQPNPLFLSGMSSNQPPVTPVTSFTLPQQHTLFNPLFLSGIHSHPLQAQRPDPAYALLSPRLLHILQQQAKSTNQSASDMSDGEDQRQKKKKKKKVKR